MFPIIRDFIPGKLVVPVPENEYNNFLDTHVLSCPEGTIVKLYSKPPIALTLRFRKKSDYFVFQSNKHEWDAKTFVASFASIIHPEEYVFGRDAIRQLVTSLSYEICCLKVQRNTMSIIIVSDADEKEEEDVKDFSVCGYLQTDPSQSKPSDGKEVFRDLFSLSKKYVFESTLC